MDMYLEGVVFTARCDTDPVIIQHRALQVTPTAAFEARIGIWQSRIGFGAALQATMTLMIIA